MEGQGTWGKNTMTISLRVSRHSQLDVLHYGTQASVIVSRSDEH